MNEPMSKDYSLADLEDGVLERDLATMGERFTEVILAYEGGDCSGMRVTIQVQPYYVDKKGLH